LLDRLQAIRYRFTHLLIVGVRLDRKRMPRVKAGSAAEYLSPELFTEGTKCAVFPF
jgi:hypothetical protein